MKWVLSQHECLPVIVCIDGSETLACDVDFALAMWTVHLPAIAVHQLVLAGFAS